MARGRRVGPVTIDTTELEQFARRIRGAGSAATRQLQADIFDAGRAVVAQARQNAARIPSRRIPRTIVLREDKTGKVAGARSTAGVRITIGGPSAPHARVWEPADGRAVVSVPVFARRGTPRTKWTWDRRKTKPYARPALAQVRNKAIRGVQAGQLKSVTRSLGD